VSETEGAWGSAETRFFYELTPDRILDAVESCGLRTTGRCMALNSMENRVYQVEVEVDGEPENPSDAFRVVKFYRPGRWSREQILEEHRFLLDLVEAEIPVVAPSVFPDGETLARLPDVEIYAAVFPRQGGRIPDELGDPELERLGRLLARLHSVGATRQAEHRIRLDPETYGRRSLAYLAESDALKEPIASRYASLVGSICDTAGPWFEGVSYQRIHGDCHLGNVLWGMDGPFLVDFDDMVVGPPVQDLWLVTGGDDAEGMRKREVFLAAYEEFRDLDRGTLRLIEPLRALRMVHFSAWIARRYDDPAFRRIFPDFGSERYWFEEIEALQECLARMHSGPDAL
jgi:Ser/Thr protein kinase RdoA (MazF antagonist)